MSLIFETDVTLPSIGQTGSLVDSNRNNSHKHTLHTGPSNRRDAGRGPAFRVRGVAPALQGGERGSATDGVRGVPLPSRQGAETAGSRRDRRVSVFECGSPLSHQYSGAAVEQCSSAFAVPWSQSWRIVVHGTTRGHLKQMVVLAQQPACLPAF